MEIAIDQNQKTLRRWSLVLPALFVPLAASFFYFVWFPGTTFGNSFYVGSKIFMIFLPVIAVPAILQEKLSDRSRPANHFGGLIAGGVFGLLTVATLAILMKFTPIGNIVYENGARIVDKIEGLGVRDHYIWFAIYVASFHAALEEYFWRLFAFGQLRKLMPLMGAVVLAAVGFSLHHIVVLAQFVPMPLAFGLGACVGLGGAVWSLIYDRFNSLRGAWLSHMIIDLGIMWVGWEILQSAN